jgi:hypothetical protein
MGYPGEAKSLGKSLGKSLRKWIYKDIPGYTGISWNIQEYPGIS